MRTDHMGQAAQPHFAYAIGTSVGVNVRTKIIQTILVVAVLAALAGIAYHFRIWERNWTSIDDGWASLIGSALGAFLAVVGALYVSKTQDRRNRKAFEDFVRVAVQNLVIQGAYLEAMSREPQKIAPTPDIQFSIISIQLRSLLDALAVFDREIAHSKDGEYELRRAVITLDSMLAESRHALSMNVEVSQAFQHWHTGAYQVRWYASSFLQVMDWIIPKITQDALVQERARIVDTWKAWNVPIESPAHLSSVTTPLSNAQHSLHHVQA